MEKLIIEKTQSTPYVCFDHSTGILQLKGESFPENVSKFYAPVLAWLRQYLASTTQTTLVEFEIVYFNSSSSKMFMNIFDILEKEAVAGRNISVKWRCSKENETAIECGEEFREDLHSLPFVIEVFS